jgi:hypothetical protein
MTDRAYNEFTSPVVYPDTYWPNNIGKTNVNNGVSTVHYDGCQGKSKAEVLQEIATDARTLIPSDVNIRFTAGSVSGRCKHACITTALDYGTNYVNRYGFTNPEHCSWRNENPFGISYVLIDNHKRLSSKNMLMAEAGVALPGTYDPAMFPYNASNLVHALAHTTVHEVAHAMGLVNPTYLYGTDGSHNSTMEWNGWIMNEGGCCPDSYRFRKGSFLLPTWKDRNAEYLHFILPRPTP